MLIIREESPEEASLIDGLLRDAYGREKELQALQTLRGTQDFLPQLSLVADEDGALRGYALFIKAAVETPTEVISAASLILLAVPQEYRRRGVGERLVRHGNERCRSMERNTLLVFGKPSYFMKLGFRVASELGLKSDLLHPEHPLLACAPNGLLERIQSGIVHYPRILKNIF